MHVSASEYVYSKLPPMASIAAQRRFIVQAQPDAYYVPDQLLEDVLDAARFASSVEQLGELPTEIVAAIERLAELARAVNTEGQPNDRLVEADPGWDAVREHSKRCLNLLGFDLAKWEKSQGL
jgi:hypothetical protein